MGFWLRSLGVWGFWVWEFRAFDIYIYRDLVGALEFRTSDVLGFFDRGLGLWACGLLLAYSLGL